MTTKVKPVKDHETLITIETCLCGSEKGVVRLEMDDMGQEFPITRCANCGIELDHTIYSVLRGSSR